MPACLRPVALRRNRDFMLLWSGQVVSTIGTRVSSLAFPLLVLALTHSPARAGLVGFARTLPYLLFDLPAGAFVDRWNPKRVMLVADAVRGIALGSIAVALALHGLTFAQVLAVAFVEGSLFIFFQLSELKDLGFLGGSNEPRADQAAVSRWHRCCTGRLGSDTPSLAGGSGLRGSAAA